MRVTKFIDIQLIKVDRHPMNKSTLDLIDYMRGGGRIPPIKVSTNIHGGYEIKDGRHRVLASKLMGLTMINARFSTKPKINQLIK